MYLPRYFSFRFHFYTFSIYVDGVKPLATLGWERVQRRASYGLHVESQHCQVCPLPPKFKEQKTSLT